MNFLRLNFENVRAPPGESSGFEVLLVSTKCGEVGIRSAHFVGEALNTLTEKLKKKGKHKKLEKKRGKITPERLFCEFIKELLCSAVLPRIPYQRCRVSLYKNRPTVCDFRRSDPL